MGRIELSRAGVVHPSGVPVSLVRLQPIDTTTLHERAYQELKHALMSGMLKPGEAVTLRGISASLGTSVMPVREAVRRLVSERALEMPTSRSIRVPTISRERFDELCTMRLLLEGEAAAAAASNIAEQEIKQLVRVNNELERRFRSGDLAGMLAGNQKFHFLIYAASRSPLLLSMIETLWLQAGAYLSLLTHIANRQHADLDFTKHDEIIEALKNGDRRSAREAIRADITMASKVYRAEIEKQSAAAVVPA